jgi:acetylornithine deacetylase
LTVKTDAPKRPATTKEYDGDGGGGAAGAKSAVLAAVDEREVLRIEQGCTRIPSLTYEEQAVAEYFAQQMRFAGLEVQVIEVEDPYGSGKRSKQPVGRLRGTGGGKSIMFDGHMDHVPVVGQWSRDPFSGDFDGTYIYGRGCEDDKGGIVSAIEAAAAIKRSGVRLKGDVLVCPVMGHKSGGIGTKDLIKRGLIADYAVNTENSGNGLATVTVGAMKARLFFGSKAPATRSVGFQRVENKPMHRFDALSRFILALGPSLRRIPEGGWLTYTPTADLPDYPQLNIDSMQCEWFAPKATLELHLRTVPGITKESLRGDLERVVAKLQEEDATIDVEIEVPPKDGQYAGWDWPTSQIEPDDRLVRAMIGAHTLVTGKAPVVGADPRLGAVGDASFLTSAGVKSVLYGPGDIESQPLGQWPAPDERVALTDLVVAAKVYALAAIDICGIAQQGEK